MEIIPINKVITICARRNSGKSVLIKWLITKYKRFFHKIFCISPTESISRFYSDLVPENCIFSEFDEAWAMKLIESCTAENAKQKGSTGPKKEVLIIMDDIFSDFNSHNSKALKIICARGRHINLSAIFILQHMTSSPPICRANSDFILAGATNRASVELLADSFCIHNLEKRDFYALYTRAIENYGFLCINTAAKNKDSNDLNNTYGILRVPGNEV